MTETSPSTHANPTRGRGRVGSIGVPLPGTSCKVVDREDPTREVPVGEPGELAVSGPQVFSGYWGKPDQEGLFTADGYLLTGDVAVMDTDGYFTIVDRKKELIIAGGFNIYPSEVEEVLFGLEGVQDVGVVGVPDRYRGETVKAYVVTKPGVTLTADDVIAHAASSLTAYKVPKLVEFRDSLPRTAVGKLLRRVLLEEEAGRTAQGGEKKKAAGTAKGDTPTPVTAAKKAAGTKTPATKAPATTTTAKKTAATKAPVKKAATKKAAATTAAPAKKAVAKAPAKKAVAKKAPAKTVTKTAAKAPATKVAAKKTPATKAPAKAGASKR
jgi:hypothetical protein